MKDHCLDIILIVLLLTVIPLVLTAIMADVNLSASNNNAYTKGVAVMINM